jgi:hypothetical protein
MHQVVYRNKTLTLQYSITLSPSPNYVSDPTSHILLIDMAVPCLLLTILEENCGHQNECDVHTYLMLAIPLHEKLAGAHIPTIPKAPVKTTSRKSLAKIEYGPTQPPRFSATSEFVQTLSCTNGGDVLFI